MAQARTIYVPNIIWGRDKYEYESRICGLFINKIDAMSALIRELYNMEFINFNENMIDEISKTYKNELLTAETFIDIICDKLETEDDLEYICDNYNDSYFGNGWKYEIVEANIQ